MCAPCVDRSRLTLLSPPRCRRSHGALAGFDPSLAKDGVAALWSEVRAEVERDSCVHVSDRWPSPSLPLYSLPLYSLTHSLLSPSYSLPFYSLPFYSLPLYSPTLYSLPSSLLTHCLLTHSLFTHLFLYHSLLNSFVCWSIGWCRASSASVGRWWASGPSSHP